MKITVKKKAIPVKLQSMPREVLVKKLAALRHNEQYAPANNADFKRLADDLEIYLEGEAA